MKRPLSYRAISSHFSNILELDWCYKGFAINLLVLVGGVVWFGVGPVHVIAPILHLQNDLLECFLFKDR